MAPATSGSSGSSGSADSSPLPTSAITGTGNDAKSRTPIWHASVSQNGSDLVGPNAEAKIGAGVAAIFTKFPIAVPLPAGGRAT